MVHIKARAWYLCGGKCWQVKSEAEEITFYSLKGFKEAYDIDFHLRFISCVCIYIKWVLKDFITNIRKGS